MRELQRTFVELIQIYRLIEVNCLFAKISTSKQELLGWQHSDNAMHKGPCPALRDGSA